MLSRPTLDSIKTVLHPLGNSVPNVTRGGLFFRNATVFVDFYFLFISVSANIKQIALLRHIGSHCENGFCNSAVDLCANYSLSHIIAAKAVMKVNPSRLTALLSIATL